MKKSFKTTIVTAGLFLAALTSNAHAGYVVDGNFDAPYGGSSFTTYSSGNSFSNWNVTSGSVDLIGGYWQEPAAGAGTVDLDGNNPGSISQTLSTGPGSFLLTFSFSGNPDLGNGVKSMAVSVGNVINQVFNYTVTSANSKAAMGYITETLAFTTSGPTTNLVFASLDNPSSPSGPVVGNVSVSAVPLPAGLPMFGAALLAMFGIHSLRKRKQLA